MSLYDDITNNTKKTGTIPEQVLDYDLVHPYVKKFVNTQYTLKEKQNINPFFLLRFVSNDPNTIYIANMLNIYKSIPIEIQYNFIKNSSLEKIAFINYPKNGFAYNAIKAITSV